MESESIKTGKKCPECGWDDGREFITSFMHVVSYVCPKCGFMGSEIEWKRAEIQADQPGEPVTGGGR